MNNRHGVSLVLERNAFYRDGLWCASLGLFLLIAVNVLLTLSILYKLFTPPAPVYFATSADGQIINSYALSEPVVSDSYVLQWTADQVRAAFSLDYLHWRQQLQTVSSSFTPDGWKYFLDSSQKSNNLKTLTSLKMVSDATIAGAPQILEKAVVDGHFAWKVQMPILVTFQNNSQTIPMAMNVTVIVLRMPVKDYPQRIAINNFLPVVQNTQEQQMLTGGGL